MTFYSVAQIEVDNKIIFEGDTTKHQIQNLSESKEASNLVTVSENITNKLEFYTAYGQDTLTLNSNNFDSLTNGMNLYIKLLSTNSGPTFLDINNLGNKEIVNSNLVSLDSGEIVINQIIHLVYYSNKFVLMATNKTKECPLGFVSISDNYCIELNEKPSVITYNDAQSYCFNKGARVCTLNEWYYACKTKESSINGMFGNYEWVDDGSNHGNDAVRIAAGSDCTNNSSSPAHFLTGYIRCCYSK